MDYDGRSFVGAKAALFYRGRLFIYQRDDKPGLRFAGLWDFFGGGREDDETPFECLARELDEELEIHIKPEQMLFSRIFPAMHDPSQDAYFMAVALTDENVAMMKFGSEGQACKFIDVEEFMKSNNCVAHLKPRLQSYLEKDKNPS